MQVPISDIPCWYYILAAGFENWKIPRNICGGGLNHICASGQAAGFMQAHSSYLFGLFSEVAVKLKN